MARISCDYGFLLGSLFFCCMAKIAYLAGRLKDFDRFYSDLCAYYSGWDMAMEQIPRTGAG